MSDVTRLGFSGVIAKRFQDSKITPLLALTGLLMGLFAVAVTPREEEPQINVTFANIFVPFPGASAVEVENLVAIPLEQVLSDGDLSAGDFVRWLRQVIDLLDQLADAAGDDTLKTTARAAVAAVNRGVVAYSVRG